MNAFYFLLLWFSLVKQIILMLCALVDIYTSRFICIDEIIFFIYREKKLEGLALHFGCVWGL